MRGCRDSTCSPWRTPLWSRWRHLKEAVARGKPVLEQVPGRTGGPVKREAHARAGLLAGLVTSWATPHWSSLLLKVCTLWERDSMLEQGNDERSPPPEDEEAAETTCDELTVTPIPRPPVLLWGEEVEAGSEVEPGKMGGVGGGVLRVDFTSHSSTQFCLVIN